MKHFYLVVLSVLLLSMGLTISVEAGTHKVDICHIAHEGNVIPRRVSQNAVSAHVNNHGDFFPQEFFIDTDGDGFGDPNNSSGMVCEAPAGFVVNSDDCDDTDGAIHPDATERTGDGIDNDCNAATPDDPCTDQLTFATLTPDMGIPWSFGIETGVQAGHEQCRALGANHACSYDELLVAASRGELTSLAADVDVWIHRSRLTVDAFPYDGSAMTAPGPGGRCNDWTESDDSVVDGEYARINFVDSSGNARVELFTHDLGATSISFYFDRDTRYTGNPSDGHAGASVADGGRCSLVSRAIVCCFAECLP